MPKIVITGHTGFIGSHIVDFFKQNNEIVGISSKLTRNTGIKQKRKNILKITEKDIPDDVSAIIHLAAITDVTFCQENPTICYEINVLGTQKMLELARKKNCSFLYFSTNHVYGKNLKLPINESHPKNPESVYATSKYLGEILCESYSKNYNLDVKIIRLFSVYGPNSPYHHVITKIISQMNTNNCIKVGNLTPKRDFIFIQDVLNAIKIILNSHTKFAIYNIGSGKSFSINEIYAILKQLTNSNTPIKSTKKYIRKSDIKNIISDSTKLRKLGWKPNYSLQEGLKLTLDNF